MCDLVTDRVTDKMIHRGAPGEEKRYGRYSRLRKMKTRGPILISYNLIARKNNLFTVCGIIAFPDIL